MNRPRKALTAQIAADRAQLGIDAKALKTSQDTLKELFKESKSGAAVIARMGATTEQVNPEDPLNLRGASTPAPTPAPKTPPAPLTGGFQASYEGRARQQAEQQMQQQVEQKANELAKAAGYGIFIPGAVREDFRKKARQALGL